MQRPRGHVAVRAEVHLVVAFLLGVVRKSLFPNGLDRLHSPLVVRKLRVDDVKVHHRIGIEPHAAHDEHRPLVERTVELRTRELGGVGDHQRRRLIRLPQRVVEALETCADVLALAHQHDRHAKGRLLEEGRGRRREQEVHVVLGSVEEDLPHPLGQLLALELLAPEAARLDGRHRKHHVVDRRSAQVFGCTRALLVLGARDARQRHALGALLAVGGAEDAHAAHAALAVRQGVARLAAVDVVHCAHVCALCDVRARAPTPLVPTRLGQWNVLVR